MKSQDNLGQTRGHSDRAPILLAIGANLPGPRGEHPLVACRAAAEAFADLPGLRVDAVSRWYETAPIPASDQPNYVNGVARLSGNADPAWLLARLQALEFLAGRLRRGRNAARTLDLDIVAMGGLQRDAPDPVLPHPRMHERRFVLVPLADVAPDWRHPRLGLTAQELLARLPAAAIRRI